MVETVITWEKALLFLYGKYLPSITSCPYCRLIASVSVSSGIEVGMFFIISLVVRGPRFDIVAILDSFVLLLRAVSTVSMSFSFAHFSIIEPVLVSTVSVIKSGFIFVDIRACFSTVVYDLFCCDGDDGDIIMAPGACGEVVTTVADLSGELSEDV